MVIGNKWAGQLYGTNTGNLYATLEGHDDDLTGRFHLNDPAFGIVVYAITGTFDGQSLSLHGEPAKPLEGVELGKLEAEAVLSSKGELEGEWTTSTGSAGTFFLLPHDRISEPDEESGAKQERLHTARHDFGAVAVDCQQISDLAKEVQDDFKQTQVVVTVLAGTEKSWVLDDFTNTTFKSERATMFRIFARERQTRGLDRIVVIEFGPQVNFSMTQGPDEAWVLGMLEKLKKSIDPLGRKYATNFRKFGFDKSQVLLLGAIVYLPSLTGLTSRVALMAGVLMINYLVDRFHRRYLPFAALFLGEKPKGVIARSLPSALSWIITLTSAVTAALLAEYLKGRLPISL